MDETDNAKTRVLIVDDEADVRILLRAQLDAFDDIEVIGEAANGQEALTACATQAPDTVIMDLLMPRMSGFEAIDLLQREHPDVAIIALTAVAGDFVRHEMNRLGIELILKTGEVDPLINAIRRSTAPG